jgi:hypothetical protein
MEEMHGHERVLRTGQALLLRPLPSQVKGTILESLVQGELRRCEQGVCCYRSCHRCDRTSKASCGSVSKASCGSVSKASCGSVSKACVLFGGRLLTREPCAWARGLCVSQGAASCGRRTISQRRGACWKCGRVMTRRRRTTNCGCGGNVPSALRASTRRRAVCTGGLCARSKTQMVTIEHGPLRLRRLLLARSLDQESQDPRPRADTTYHTRVGALGYKLG